MDILSCGHSGAMIFDKIFFILAGNEDNREVSNEFEIRLVPITDFRVTCPWASEKIPVDL